MYIINISSSISISSINIITTTRGVSVLQSLESSIQCGGNHKVVQQRSTEKKYSKEVQLKIERLSLLYII